jgi:uncharacterized damage-inducible protein DinB
VISIQYARTMASYNRWMNDRLYDCCARLSEEERKRDRGAFFGSIHGTLNHLLLGDRIWLGRFQGKPYPAKSLAEELYADFAELRSERGATDASITSWIVSLADTDFTRELEYVTMANPQTKRQPLWLAVTHFFNHQTHHRGQLTTLLFQQGIDPGVTDLIWLPGLQSRQASGVTDA